ncbi:MAG: hypothetical protein R3F60_02370 [bacterium]
METTSQVPGPVPPALMESAASGIHPLFDPPAIRRAFARLRQGLLSQPALMDAHQALRYLTRFEGLDDKRAYLAVLPPDTVDVLIYLYFRSVDAWMSRQEGVALH